jgi:branched-chain amino acid transport system substrate-binding protein
VKRHGAGRAGSQLAVALVIAAVVAACSNGSDDARPTTTVRTPVTTQAARRVSDDHLSIGVLLPESGVGAAFGAPLVGGVRMAATEINSAGGVNGRQIELVMRNEGSDAGEAAISLDGLLDAGVDAIVGPASSRIAANLLARTVRAGVPVCSPTATAIGLDDFPDNRLFFRTVPSDSLQAMALAAAIVETGRSAVAVLYADDDYGSQFENSLRNALVSRQASITSAVSFDTSAPDLSTSAADVMEKEPEVVAVIGDTDAGSRMLSALRDEIQASGSPMPSIFLNDAMRDPAVLAPATAADRQFVAAIRGTSPQAIPQSQEFTHDFELSNPGISLDYSAYAYDCLMTIALAAQSAQSDLPADIKDAMVSVTQLGSPCRGFQGCARLLADGRNINLDGASGPLDLNDEGDAVNADFDVFEFAAGRDLTIGSIFVSR